jgi:hypothetical protein
MSDQVCLSKDEVYELLSFLANSAHLCVNEPKLYGTFRLVDAASRMLGFVLDDGGSDDEFLQELKNFIDDNKLALMTDEEGYIAFLQENTRRLARQMKRRAKAKREKA